MPSYPHINIVQLWNQVKKEKGGRHGKNMASKTGSEDNDKDRIKI